MSHAKNKVRWCLIKAERELKDSDTHRGLVETDPNKEKAAEHINKAEHYLNATIYLKEGNYSDISASTVFYAMYQCLLAIAAKFGYESRNQECTFALVNSLIEDKQIDLDKDMLEKISSFETERSKEQTTVKVRERYQYGTSLTLEDSLYDEQLELAKKVIAKTKVIIER
ncbi:MAG: hypothetical protein KJ601_05285 [Nanoarchaeota archaeon]|nr:hypothetical protein [Nanoarchaeota archaeon]MBU1704587.1 hypothetical protein [Nanoarchaeota archaeon]